MGEVIFPRLAVTGSYLLSIAAAAAVEPFWYEVMIIIFSPVMVFKGIVVFVPMMFLAFVLKIVIAAMSSSMIAIFKKFPVD